MKIESNYVESDDEYALVVHVLLVHIYQGILTLNQSQILTLLLRERDCLVPTILVNALWESTRFKPSWHSWNCVCFLDEVVRTDRARGSTEVS